VPGDAERGRHTRCRQALQERGERYVLEGPCPPSIRALAAPLPAYQGRGRRPKAPWHSGRAWRHALAPEGWTQLTVRAGDKGPVESELVTRRVQPRRERQQTGPPEWLVGMRRPLADAGTVAGQAALEAREQEARDG
jgi:hypothetical protein